MRVPQVFAAGQELIPPVWLGTYEPNFPTMPQLARRQQKSGPETFRAHFVLREGTRELANLQVVLH